MAISLAALGTGVTSAQDPARLPTGVTNNSDINAWRAWPEQAMIPTPVPVPVAQPKPINLPTVLPVGMIPQVQDTSAQTGSGTPPPPAATMGSAPKKEDIFRMDSDSVLNSRIRRDSGKKDFEIPGLPQLAPKGSTYTVKTGTYPPMAIAVEPGYVVHRRLYFEEKNAERQGWEFGLAQPAISTAYFYRDVLAWPYKLASNMCERYDTSAGKCLPGTPMPYFLYPPETSITGLAFEGVIITGASWILP